MATVWIPTGRFLAVLDACSVTKERLDVLQDRKVRELRTGRQEAISLDAVDRILSKLGLTEWMHLPKEQGGLGDLYFEEETFTPSWVRKAKARLEVARGCRRNRYSSDEERRAANNKQQRRSARRLNKHCKCGTQITNKAKTCKPCFLAELPAPAHGTNSRYASAEYKCRCDLCRAASSRYHRDRRRRVKAEYLETQRRTAA